MNKRELLKRLEKDLKKRTRYLKKKNLHSNIQSLGNSIDIWKDDNRRLGKKLLELELRLNHLE